MSDYGAAGGRQALNQRVELQDGLHASLTTTRLHATAVYVVALVDSTGRLADPRSLRTLTRPDAAERALQALAEKHRPKPTPRDYPKQAVAEPKQARRGRWLMEFNHRGTKYRRAFTNQADARAWRDEIKRSN